MQNLNEHNITDEVVRRFKHVPSPRLQEIMTSLIKHLHEFAREVHLTEDEWFQGIQFLTHVGQISLNRREIDLRHLHPPFLQPHQTPPSARCEFHPWSLLLFSGRYR